ncbi:MAG: hypothetical protein AAF560_00430 [Acidobacteriota bacterium]
MQEHSVLSHDELYALVERVFQPTDRDTHLAVITDLPSTPADDLPAWRQRRELAANWAQSLAAMSARTGLTADFYLYPNVGQNNADLPDMVWPYRQAKLPSCARDLENETAEPFHALFERTQIVIAPTQYSTTAPLKLAAAKHGFRAATMPGFSNAMVPALRLDYVAIDQQVRRLKDLLDRAEAAYFRFETDAGSAMLELDLRFRTAHASSGLVTQPGTAGNLPSGEAYIVPYEGERQGTPSRSSGILPVQFGEEVVSFRVEGNRAVGVESDGPASRQQARKLRREPAYGNIAELGLGVLSGFGIQPIGTILLDEKLGLHIAFGRSDHFGGQVGARHFSSPDQAVHIDWVYLSATQPAVQIRSLMLELPGGETFALMRDQSYAI